MIVHEDTGQDQHSLKLCVAAIIVDQQSASRASAMKRATGNDLKLLTSRPANLVVGWAIKYYDKYQKPIGSNIQDRFDRWAANRDDDDDVVVAVSAMLSDLSALSERLAEYSSEYLVDQVDSFLKGESLRQVSEKIQTLVSSGDVSEAGKVWQSFSIPVTSGTVTEVSSMTAADFDSALNQQSTLLIQHGDALANFFRGIFSRDSFVAFVGVEKRGKSFWLLDCADRAWLSGCRVAYFEVGDMSKQQVLTRFAERITGRVRKWSPDKTLKIPETMIVTDGSVEDVYFREIPPDRVRLLSPKKTASALRRRADSLGSDSLLRMSNHPNSSISIDGIRDICLSWASQGWVPDVVIIDYADILAGTSEREGINETWKGMRRLSQELHCCVITASQADAAAYDVPLLGMKNFSEDKRKWAHVTAGIGINQTVFEKSLGVQRLNFVCVRDEEVSSSHVVSCAGCLSIANPSIQASF